MPSVRVHTSCVLIVDFCVPILWSHAGCLCVVLPAALRQAYKKQAPGILGHGSCVVFCSLCNVLRVWYLFVIFRGLPGRVCGGWLHRFGDLRKNTPLDFWNMYLSCSNKFEERTTQKHHEIRTQFATHRTNLKKGKHNFATHRITVNQQHEHSQTESCPPRDPMASPP
jgi:hypothetical protein